MSVILAELTRGTCAVAGVFYWLLNLAILLLFNFANGNLADITALAAGSAVAVRGYARHRSPLAPAG